MEKRFYFSVLLPFFLFCFLTARAGNDNGGAKPTKAQKKEAKALTSEGWKVVSGDKELVYQLMDCEEYREKQLANADGELVERYVIGSASHKSKKFNLAMDMARNRALADITATVKTQVASIVDRKIENYGNGEGVMSRESLLSKTMAHAEGTLKDCVTLLSMYRLLPDGSTEVRVMIAYDMLNLLQADF